VQARHIHKIRDVCNPIVIRLSRARRAKKATSGDSDDQSCPEAIMPAYEICYLDEAGGLTYKFSANCDDDRRAKILAHAMKLPSAKKLEVWSGETLIYTRPSAMLERQLLHAQLLHAS
jgi:hypothetical protein